MSHSLQYELTDGTAGKHPVEIIVVPALTSRNRLTSAFRLILAFPHLMLVGAPAALAISFIWQPDPDRAMDWTAGGGILGAAAMIVAIISWFAIVFTGRMPEGLWNFSAFYLRWRVRAVAYIALLHDDYPPFGEGLYPAEVTLTPPPVQRNRLSVTFRMFLVIPHIIALWALGVAWMVTTVYAWFAILLTGNYPKGLYEFAIGVLRWSSSVESYLLLLHDEYPPFSLSR
jgi:hypothetical protein